MPEPYVLLNFAIMGESQGVGTGAAGFGGAPAGLTAAGVAGGVAAGFGGVEVSEAGEGLAGVVFVSD